MTGGSGGDGINSNACSNDFFYGQRREATPPNAIFISSMPYESVSEHLMRVLSWNLRLPFTESEKQQQHQQQ